jgi:bidirectional [NiFe] hydrogenase diaphorase subunit
VTVRTLTLDGKPVSARPDETVLDLCRENGAPLPTLCHLDGLSDVGACRLCLVEVKGSPRLHAACTTLVQEGMEIVTSSERLLRYRRQIVELLFAERNHVCAICVANGSCELQEVARLVGMESVRYPYRHPPAPLDASHPRFVADPGRCVLCTRCVRVCDEIEGAHTWDVAGRGATSHVITDLAQPWGKSESCTGCGKCVQVCPTGALFEKAPAAGGTAKRRDFLSYLRNARERKEWIR